MFQEQRVVLCTSLALADKLVVGYNATTTPLNLQDLSNSGIVSYRAYQLLGLELSWTGTPTGSIAAQGSIAGVSFSTLANPLSGSANPDFVPPPVSDDQDDEAVLTMPTGANQVPNPVLLSGSAASALMTWDLSRLRLNFLQLLIGLSQGSGSLTATLSLVYQT